MKQLRNTQTSTLPLSTGAYVYSIASTTAKLDLIHDTTHALTRSDRLAVISSDNTLSILDPETLNVVPDGHFKDISSSVTCIKSYAEVNQPANIVFTAGRDGQIRGWDLRTLENVLTLSTPNDNLEALSAIDTNFATSSVVAGTELEGNGPGNVSIFFWDVRAAPQPRMKYSESHTDTITELHYLPYPSSSAAASTVLLSGSTDGLVTTFDTTIADEDDAVLQVINHHSAIHRTGLVGGTNNEIYALATDEKLAFYVQQSQDPETQDPDHPHVLGDVRDTLECDYALKIWNATAQPLLAVGRHNEDVQDLRLVPLARQSSDQAGSPPHWALLDDTSAVVMPGGHGSEVIRDLYCVDTQSVVFTCGEDGTVKQWSI